MESNKNITKSMDMGPGDYECKPKARESDGGKGSEGLEVKKEGCLGQILRQSVIVMRPALW